MSSTRSGVAVERGTNMEDSMDNESEEFEHVGGKAKRPKMKCVPLKRKGTGVKKVPGGSLAKHKANLSLNTSVVRQTLRSNNRSLARALELARLEISNLQKENVDLKAQQVQQETRMKKRLGEINDVSSMMREKLLSSVSLLDVLQSMCMDDFSLDQTIVGNQESTGASEEKKQTPPSNSVDDSTARALDAHELDKENPIVERSSSGGIEELRSNISNLAASVPVVNADEVLETESQVAKLTPNTQLEEQITQPTSTASLELSTVLEKSYFNDEITIMFSEENSSKGSGDGGCVIRKPRSHSRSRSGRRSAMIYQSSNIDLEGSGNVDDPGPRRSLRARSRSRRRTKSSFGQGDQCVVEEKSSDFSPDHVTTPSVVGDKERTSGESLRREESHKDHNRNAETLSGTRKSGRLSLKSKGIEVIEQVVQEKEIVEGDNVFKPKKEIPRTPPSRRTSTNTSLEKPNVSFESKDDHIVQLPKFISLGVDSPQPKKISPVKFDQSNVKKVQSKKSDEKTSQRKLPANENLNLRNKRAHEEVVTDLCLDGDRISENVNENAVPTKEPISECSTRGGQIVKNPEIRISLENDAATTLAGDDDDATIIMNYCLTPTDLNEKSKKESPHKEEKSVSDCNVGLEEPLMIQAEVSENATLSKNAVTREPDEIALEDAKTTQKDKNVHSMAEAGKRLKKQSKLRLKDHESGVEYPETNVPVEVPEEEEVLPKRNKQRHSRAHLRRGTYCLDQLENEVTKTDDGEPIHEALPIEMHRQRKEKGEESGEAMAKTKEKRSRRGTYCVDLDAEGDDTLSRDKPKARERRGTFCVEPNEEERESKDVEEISDIMDEVGDMLVDDIDFEMETIPQENPLLEPPAVQPPDETICMDEDMEMTEAINYHISVCLKTEEECLASVKNEKKMKAVPKKVRRVVSKEEKAKTLKLRAEKEAKRKDPNPGAHTDLAYRLGGDEEVFDSNNAMKSRHNKDLADDDIFKKPEVPFKPPKNMISVRKPKSSSNSSSDSDPTETEKEKADLTALTGRPGKIIFTAGRKVIDPTKTYLENLNKPKSRSKSKVKSLLPRPDKAKAKKGRSKTRLSSQKDMKMGFDKEKKTVGDRALKSVFDLSMNDSLTVLPQMSYTDFREQNPAMEEMKEALKKKNMGDNTETCSPHGIMLVVRNGKRTKPRMRSKSVSYAKKLTEVHLRTPSRSSDDSHISYQILTEGAGRTPPTKKEDSVRTTKDAPLFIPDTPDTAISKKSTSTENVGESHEEFIGESPSAIINTDGNEPKHRENGARDSNMEMGNTIESIEETPQPPMKPSKVDKKKRPPTIQLEMDREDAAETLNVRRGRSSKPNTEVKSSPDQDDDFIPSSQEDPSTNDKVPSKTAILMKKLKAMRQKTLALSVSAPNASETSNDATPRSRKSRKQPAPETGTPRSSSRKRSAEPPVENTEKPDTEEGESKSMPDSKRSLAQEEYLTNLDRVPLVKRSRRGASCVSYKEPSLNTKMRRDPEGIRTEDGKGKSNTKRKSSKKTSRGVLSTITNTDSIDAT